MKLLSVHLLLAALVATSASGAGSTTRSTDTVILDATGVKNLRLQTVVAEESDFEETAFALGRIEARPERVTAVSSRISGRVVALTAFPGDTVAAGAEVARIESRQPGGPAPVIPLTAPLAGLVTRTEVRLGDPVEPDRALLEIADLSEVYAVARVPEHLAGRLQPGTRAHITVTALPGEKFEGELLRFGTQADPSSGTLDAVFRLPNPRGLLRPGLRAEFALVLSRRANVVSVPRAALQGEPSRRFVYVKDFTIPHAFVKTPVVTGQTNDRFVEIISGLLPADEVVTQGAYSLAFSGGGSVSLKDALDAAHGHAHAADGSELKEGSKAADDDHGHDHAEGGEEPSHLWPIVSGVLFVLLLVSLVIRRRPAPASHSNA